MKIGVALPHYGDDASVAHVVGIAQECEQLGFDSVWVSDHLVFDLGKYGGSSDPIGVLDPLVVLSVLSAETQLVRLGTMVLCNEFRHPVVLAKTAATIANASGGRLELGIGAGWYEPEFVQTGIDFPSARVRLERLEESATVLKRLFTGDPVTSRGRYYPLDGIVLRPAPNKPPTIWIGGKGDRAVALAGRVGDGWNAAWFQDTEAYSERATHLGGANVKRSVGQYAQGSAQEMTDRLRAFAELGVEHVVMCFSTVPFGLDDPDDIARFQQDVLPHVR